jgi:hypothetical protein
MVPHEGSGMSLRWEFAPEVAGAERAVRWRWRAHTQSARLFAESRQSFDTLTECVEDAKQHGYHPPAE